jgi:hypothetical protein
MSQQQMLVQHARQNWGAGAVASAPVTSSTHQPVPDVPLYCCTPPHLALLQRPRPRPTLPARVMLLLLQLPRLLPSRSACPRRPAPPSPPPPPQHPPQHPLLHQLPALPQALRSSMTLSQLPALRSWRSFLLIPLATRSAPPTLPAHPHPQMMQAPQAHQVSTHGIVAHNCCA